VTTRPALLLAAGLALCASCAGPPPERELGQADLALRAAETSGAAERAPAELALAREKRDRALAAADRGDADAARRLAVEATVDARLAETRAEAAAAETARIEIERRLRP
jgi:hypothetical protein